MIGVLGADTALGGLTLSALAAEGADCRPATLSSLGGLLAVVDVVPNLIAVGAAVSARVPYVDAATDAAFVGEVLGRHAAAPVPVVPACGIEGLLCDLVAAVAAEHYGGPLDRIEVHLDDTTGPVLGSDRVLSPLLEDVLLPRHAPATEVVASMVLPLPHHFRVVAEATGPGPGAFVACEGAEPAAISARLLARAAVLLSRQRARPDLPTGAMGPGEAFDAERFLDAVAGPDLRWSFVLPEPGDLTV